MENDYSWFSWWQQGAHMHTCSAAYEYPCSVQQHLQTVPCSTAWLPYQTTGVWVGVFGDMGGCTAELHVSYPRSYHIISYHVSYPRSCSFVPVYSSSTHACVLLAQVGHHSPQALLALAWHSTGHSMLRRQHLHNSPLPLFATGTHRHPLTCLKKNHTDHMRQ